jgi:hypothetical protein
LVRIPLLAEAVPFKEVVVGAVVVLEVQPVPVEVVVEVQVSMVVVEVPKVVPEPMMVPMVEFLQVVLVVHTVERLGLMEEPEET